MCQQTRLLRLKREKERRRKERREKRGEERIAGGSEEDGSYTKCLRSKLEEEDLQDEEK